MKMKLRKGDELINVKNLLFYNQVKKASRKTDKLISFEEFYLYNYHIPKIRDKKIIEKIEDEESKETKLFIKECLKRKIMLFSMTQILRKHLDVETKQYIKKCLENLEKGETVDLVEILEQFGNIFIYATICIKDPKKKIEHILEYILDESYETYNI
jgi:hypothetical protein